MSDFQAEFTAGLGEAWTTIATFIPAFAAFLLVLIVGYLVARIIARGVGRVLQRVGFNRAVARGGIERVLEGTQYDASTILGRLVFYLVMLFVLQLAFGVFGPNPVSDLIQGVVAYLPNVFAAIVIIVVGAAIAAAVKDLVAAAIGGLSYGRNLAVLAATTVLVITTFAALDQLRIAPTVVTGLFYALLAIVVGSAIVAFGGGGIPTARDYIGRWADRVNAETEAFNNASVGAEPRRDDRVADHLPDGEERR